MTKRTRAEMLPIGEPVVIPDDTVVIEVGSIEKLDDASDSPVAVLWVPDIDARHKWREYAVKRQDMPKPGARKMGYQK